MSTAVEQAAQDLRAVYLEKALGQVPRLLSLLDRNPFSPTYGCFHREYWLDKAIDFPDAMAQFSVQALALVYTRALPGNVYFGQPKVRDWTIAALDYWARIQHADGSFDEFYPYERGWAGPTGFTLYAAIEAYQLLDGALPPEVAARVLAAIRRAAHFMAAGEAEQDHLANHHALACLAVRRAYELLGDSELQRAYERLWQGFLKYQHRAEGWSTEYDGADPGYLSATISFLAKIYQQYPSPEILELAGRAVEFASYFAYPNGYYGGSMGSRQTLHFYPHGVEVFADQIPLAGSLAQRMLEGLDGGALVPPEIMPDRYLGWRVAEFLLAYLDARPRPTVLPALPYERAPFSRWFPDARIYVRRDSRSYLLVNLAKGGVIKLFDTARGRLVYNDCGIVGRLVDGTLVTSQWIDPSYRVKLSDDLVEVEGSLQRMTSTKSFTPARMAAFRALLVTVGRSPRASHLIKGGIRRLLMLGTRSVPLRFRRTIHLEQGGLTVTDTLRRTGKLRVAGLMLGDEFAVRYVPQSRYFQAQELDLRGSVLTPEQVANLNRNGDLEVTRRVSVTDGLAEAGDSLEAASLPAAGSAGEGDR
jgi:hypothetical protein